MSTQPSILPSYDYETIYYQSDEKEQRKIVRAALAAWRAKHPEHKLAKPIHDGWFGWVMRSTVEESRIVANVMTDCIVPYLRERERR